MSDATKPLTKAVIAVVKTAVAPVKVYTDVPEKTAFPYVVFGDNEASTDATKTDDGQKHKLTFFVFTKDKSRSEALDLVKKIYDALHEQEETIEVVGHDLIEITYQRSGCNLLTHEGDTYWDGDIEFQAITEPS